MPLCQPGLICKIKVGTGLTRAYDGHTSDWVRETIIFFLGVVYLSLPKNGLRLIRRDVLSHENEQE